MSGKRLTPGGGGDSDIFEQHRLICLGVHIRINIFGSGDFFR